VERHLLLKHKKFTESIIANQQIRSAVPISFVALSTEWRTKNQPAVL